MLWLLHVLTHEKDRIACPGKRKKSCVSIEEIHLYLPSSLWIISMCHKRLNFAMHFFSKIDLYFMTLFGFKSLLLFTSLIGEGYGPHFYMFLSSLAFERQVQSHYTYIRLTGVLNSFQVYFGFIPSCIQTKSLECDTYLSRVSIETVCPRIVCSCGKTGELLHIVCWTYMLIV